MKRIASILGVALLALLFTAGPAGALTESLPACAGKSGINYDVRVCAIFGWRMQNDGTGVHVENVELYTSKGCGDLESQAFSSVTATSVDTGGQRIIGDQYGCDVTWNLELNGSDNGAGQFIAHAHVKVNNASDFDVDLVCTIRPNNPDDCFGQAYN